MYMKLKMAKKNNLANLTMEFYDDIDVDFGDKEQLGVGEMIDLFEDHSISNKNTNSRRTNQKPKEIVFEDELDSDEYERYNPSSIDYLTNPTDPDFVDSIAREVSEVTGNEMLNEQLENRYRQQFPPSKPKKTSSRKKTTDTQINRNITKKSELRKEMAFHDDSIVTFMKKNRSNALVNSVALKKKDSTESLKIRETEVESLAAIEEKKTDSSVDSDRSYSYLRTQNWINSLNDSVEDEFYSANDTNTDSSYFTASASASDTETPRRTYRATSKRNAKKPSPPPIISDASVGFKVAPKVTPPAPSKPATPKPAPPKPAKSKFPVTKNQIYIPGSYNREFNMKPADFPAIR